MAERKRHVSIRVQFALIFIALMLLAILACGIFNVLFLEEYYLEVKRNTIHEAYDSIRAAAEQDSYETDKFIKELEDVCEKDNITICVVDVDSQIRYVSQNGGRQLEAKLFGYIFGYDGQQVVQVLEQGEDYRIQITGKGRGEYLEMYGRLTSGISFIMQTPLDSIRENAGLANRFMGYVGGVLAFIGGVVIFLVSYRITKPIAQLSKISEEMVHLNFDARYDQRRHRGWNGYDEIDQLGDNINRLSASLEETISELKTANNELKRDIESRQQADEMRKEFLSNVSHELKTPIALIQGYAEGLQEGINDDEESRAFYCEVIVDEASKMNQMVQRLMTLNELEYGNDVINMERFDLVELIRNYVQSASLVLAQKEIQVDVEEHAPIYVWADEFKTQEVFTNYFSNALNHCAGAKRIEVRMQHEDGFVRVEVFNTGAPIPEESLPRIWDKFYKVDKARTREYGGNGVGLSIVKAIQESMHQTYGVENRADGVAFWFTLETVQE
ncbi:MAG: two-component sensor histidine kinase [Lachnospiraceae bacterium]|nr:two-component sensor histidine kinase [Lachnospiraceae bacterium]